MSPMIGFLKDLRNMSGYMNLKSSARILDWIWMRIIIFQTEKM